MRNNFRIEGGKVAIWLSNKGGMWTYIDLADLPLMDTISTSWCAKKDIASHTFYVVSSLKGPNGKMQHWKLHRVLMGVTDPKVIIDHKDHDGLNNQRSNLRIVSGTLNSFNRRWGSISSTSPYRNLTRTPRGTWQLRITFQKNVLDYGIFQDAEEANRVAIMARNCLEAGERYERLRKGHHEAEVGE